MKSPEMMKTQQEMEEKKKQLEEIERQLGMFADLGVRIDFKLFILSAFLIGVCSTSSVNTSKTSETGSCGCWWALLHHYKESKAEIHISI